MSDACGRSGQQRTHKTDFGVRGPKQRGFPLNKRGQQGEGKVTPSGANQDAGIIASTAHLLIVLRNLVSVLYGSEDVG